MAEYSEVIKQFNRMCKSTSSAECISGKCPMECVNKGQCRKKAFEEPALFTSIVMQWAAEHPEPVYPTWAEYLMHTYQDVSYSRILGKNIPADIAQKLGIEPKEG